ncbi:MAG: helix-hairpin-helix domain-containing protein [Pseudomonadota bacterium]
MSKLTPEAETALRLPVGVVSPLWLMFAGAAMTGAAVYWARNWYKATNLEALTPLPAFSSDPEIAVKEAAIAAEPIVEAVEEVVEVAEDVVLDTVVAVELAIEQAPEIVEEIAAPVIQAADDLTRLSGIGPKLAASLAERGVTRFAEIAAWTAEDVSRFDKDMKLMGRVEREAWIAQAKRFAEALT